MLTSNSITVSASKPSGLLFQYLCLKKNPMDTVQTLSVDVPVHKIGAIKRDWFKIYTPVVELCKLQIRMNLKTRRVDLRTCSETENSTFLERAHVLVKAVLIGFSVEDAFFVLKEDAYLYSFEVYEVKLLKGDHLSRAIGRIIGRNGVTKRAIETTSKTKIAVVDTKVHILGGSDNIDVAKDAICRLIMGSEPSKIHNRLRTLSAKLKEKYGQFETVYNRFD
uniref:Pre-rRNA-processing protein PNO1 n=1 Tax=Antonospora locustae TaxID=278021 RepID=O09355_ANTLO|nr:unknown [Antonospora locustae]